MTRPSLRFLPHSFATAASLLLLLSSPAIRADDKQPPPADAPAGEKPKPEDKKPEPARKPEDAKPKETSADVTIGGAPIKYIAKTGTLPLLKEDGSGERAHVFFVYYAALAPDGKPLAARDPAKRPITYCFNGGPGASAAWLQFGGLGPRKVEFDPTGLEPRVRGPVVPNPQSVLDVTDLVFIDPVGTGASRAAKGEKPDQFWNVNGDLDSVGEFIRSFTTRELRWASPKFLCGESYGGARGAGLCDLLQSKYGLYLDGFISVSGIVNLGTIHQDLLAAVCYLPAYTATAHFHHKLPADLQADRDKAIAASRAFAQGEYVRALLLGSSISPGELKTTAQQLSRFTGLDQTLIERAHLVLEPGLFRENLLRPEGKIVGRFDSRVTGEDYHLTREQPDFDPSYSNIYGSFSAAANAYLRSDLGYEWELPYRVLGGVNWSWRDFEGESVNLEERLARAITNNPRLHVLFCTGLSDLAVPADSALYTINHLEIPASLRKNLSVESYESGHMMYLNQPDAEKLRRDVVKFITAPGQ